MGQDKSYRLRCAAFGALALTLASCGGKNGNSADKLDSTLIGNASGNQADPALTSALEDQIMVDPSLTQQSNDHSARATGGPVQAPIPPAANLKPLPEPITGKGMLHAPDPTRVAADGGRGSITLGALAEEQTRGPKGVAKGCAPDLEYSQAWAQRLPADIPLFPNAVVSEAAGDDAPGCRVRVVSFTSAAPVRSVIDYYYTRAIRAGYDAQHMLRQDDHILAGARDADGSAYYLIVTPRAGGGSDIDLIANIGG